MAILTDVLNGIDDTVSNLAQTTAGSLAGEVAGLLAVLGLMGFFILALNMYLQIVPMALGTGISWTIRFGVIFAAATSAAFFTQMYDAVTDGADGLAGLFLGGTDLTTGLQSLIDSLLESANTMWDTAGFTDVGLVVAAIVIYVVVVFLTAVSVLVIGIAKIGLAIALGLAPLFIMLLLFGPTASFFGTWTKFTLGFAMIIILTAGIVGSMIALFQSYGADADPSEGLSGMIELLVVSVSSIFFITQIPTYGTALAGSVSAAGASLAGVAQKSLGFASGTAKVADKSASTASNAASSIKSGVEAAKQTEGSKFTKARAAGANAKSTYSQNKADARTASDPSRLRSAVRQNAKARKRADNNDEPQVIDDE